MTHIPKPPPRAWTWTTDGWCRLTPDGRRLEWGGNGLEPVEPVPVYTVGDAAPVAPWWRRWLRRSLLLLGKVAIFGVGLEIVCHTTAAWGWSDFAQGSAFMWYVMVAYEALWGAKP